jgi:hypothetical protein
MMKSRGWAAQPKVDTLNNAAEARISGLEEVEFCDDEALSGSLKTYSRHAHIPQEIENLLVLEIQE